MLKYNVCFIRRGEELLMLNRNKAPLCGLWQGVGGKLELGETPYASVLREVYEETGIGLAMAHFAGVVTWKIDGCELGGMYVYVAVLPTDAQQAVEWEAPRETEEGILAWKTIDWVTRADNEGVAKHVRHYLKAMLELGECREFRCTFREGRLISCEPQPLEPIYTCGVEPDKASG